MIAPTRLACQVIWFAALGLVLAGCASKPVGEMPAAATAPAAAAPSPAAQADAPPMDRPEANAQCWMKYDKSNISLEAKAKLVEKCADEKMEGR
jgi:hypothetical protein